MRACYSIAVIFLLLTAGSLRAADSLEIVQGGTLFKQNCTACHSLDQRLVGPALKGVDQRHDEAWLLKFIKSSQSLVLGGDSAAVALFSTYNSVVMPDQNLDEGQIRAILAFIKDSEQVRTTKPGDIPRPDVVATGVNVRPPKFSDYRFWILYTITVVLVIVSIYYKAELIALQKQVEGKTEA